VAFVFNVINDTIGLIYDGWVEIFDLISSFSIDGFVNAIKDIPAVMREVAKDIIGIHGGDDANPVLGDLPNNIIGGGLSGLFRQENEQSTSQLKINKLVEARNDRIAGNQAKAVIEKVNINIYGGSDTAEQIALETSNQLQQTAQDLITTVDQ